MSPDDASATHFRPATYAASDAERPAVITANGQVVTFGQLEERSSRLAQALFSHGLRPGDHVAVLLPNDHRTHEVAFALQRSGLYYTMVNTHLAADEATYIVADCGARTLITSDTLAALATELVDRTPDIELRLMIGTTPDDAPAPGPHLLRGVRRRLPGRTLGRRGRRFGHAVFLGHHGTPQGDPAPADRSALRLRRGPLGHARRIMGFVPGDVYLSPAPLYHSAPLVWSMTAQRMGGTVVVMEHFDPERCLALIEEHKVTHAQFVPTMFVRMLKLSDEVRNSYGISSLRSVVHAAAPCAPEVKRRMIDWWGPVVHEYYSGTEGMGMTWITSPEALTHPGSVGKPIWGEVHVCADDGEDLPPGDDGVVYFAARSGAATFQYNHDPEKTRQTFNDKGWATLWDVGHVDDEGYLYLTDRKLFMIVSGGVNIYPQEIEDVLVLHPAVADVAVFGIPDPEMGEEVKAVVQPAPGTVPGPDLEKEIIAFCRAHLSHYKCPRTVDFTDLLPRGENGKLYKKALRDAYWATPAPSTT